MAIITSTSDPSLHAALVSERDSYENDAGWVWYQQLQYIVQWTTTGEIAFEHIETLDMAKSTSDV